MGYVSVRGGNLRLLPERLFLHARNEAEGG